MVLEIAGDLAPHDQGLAPVENNDDSLGRLATPRPTTDAHINPASQVATDRDTQQRQANPTTVDPNDVAHPAAFAPTSSLANQPQPQAAQLEQPVATTSRSDVAQATTEPDTTAYHLKWIFWSNGMIPIVMQSNNGPCPLIAIMNVLLLKEKIKLPSMLEQVTEAQLLAYIGESIMDTVLAPEVRDDEGVQLNLEQNIHDAIEILPKLKVGLDVNIRFTGIEHFEYTPQCIIFDLLRIPLYHGWLIDPDMLELQMAVGQQSYNQLIDYVVTNRPSQDPVISTRVLLAEEFLDKTASQLTSYGLDQLRAQINDNEIGILFRNNHFLVIFKREGQIYTLVTDHGYLTEDSIVWETLDSIEGAGIFFDSNFQLSEITNRQASELKAIDQRQQQLVNDYLVALSLKEDEENKQASSVERQQLEMSDLEVARRLQAEEDGLAAQEQARRREQRPRSAPDNNQPAPREAQAPLSAEAQPQAQQQATRSEAGQRAPPMLDPQQFPELQTTVDRASPTIQDRVSQLVRQQIIPSAYEGLIEVVPQEQDRSYNQQQQQQQQVSSSTPVSNVPDTTTGPGTSGGNGTSGSIRARSEKSKESTCRVQ